MSDIYLLYDEIFSQCMPLLTVFCMRGYVSFVCLLYVCGMPVVCLLHVCCMRKSIHRVKHVCFIRGPEVRHLSNWYYVQFCFVIKIMYTKDCCVQ